MARGSTRRGSSAEQPDKAQPDQPAEDEEKSASGRERRYTWLDEDGRLASRKLTEYECQLEDDVQMLQDALFSISSRYAKVQFRLRQIASASGHERVCLLQELERVTSQSLDHCDLDSEVPNLLRDSQNLGNVRVRQQKIIAQLRSRLTDLADLSDVCLCGDPDCSHRLEPAEADRSSLSLSPDEPHDKFCSCIVCKESADRSTAPTLEDGYVSEVWRHDEMDELSLSDDYAEKSDSRRKKKKKAKPKGKHASARAPAGSSGDLRQAYATRLQRNLKQQESSWIRNGGAQSKLVPMSQLRPDSRSQTELRRSGRTSSASLSCTRSRSRSSTGPSTAEPKKKPGARPATGQGCASRNDPAKRIPARPRHSRPEPRTSASNRSSKSCAPAPGLLPGIASDSSSIRSLERKKTHMAMGVRLSGAASPTPPEARPQIPKNPVRSLGPPPVEANWAALMAELRTEFPQRDSFKSCLRSKDAKAQCRKRVRYEEPADRPTAGSSSQLQVPTSSSRGRYPVYPSIPCGGPAATKPNLGRQIRQLVSTLRPAAPKCKEPDPAT